MRMTVKVLREAGWQEALWGLSLSYNADLEKMPDRALKLCGLDGGHNKFLESISVWLAINAPRNWWQEFDTYRVGTSRNSESTMHTLKKQVITLENFNNDNIPQATIDHLNSLIQRNAPIEEIKDNLPEGYLQMRQVCTNYKTLRWIIQQRKTHRLPTWHVFVDSLREQLQHPEYLP